MTSEDLKSEIERLDQQIHQLGVERMNKSRELAEMKSPYRIGDRVKSLRTGKTYVIIAFDDYWPIGKQIKKNGEPGAQELNLYGTLERINP